MIILNNINLTELSNNELIDTINMLTEYIFKKDEYINLLLNKEVKTDILIKGIYNHNILNILNKIIFYKEILIDINNNDPILFKIFNEYLPTIIKNFNNNNKIEDETLNTLNNILKTIITKHNEYEEFKTYKDKSYLSMVNFIISYKS